MNGNAGGAAGCVLARRLAEDTSCTVLLVERGDARDNWLDRFPIGSTHHWSDQRHSMVIKTDMLKQKIDVITGKGLGGTSRINAMQYSRGTPGEYNGWARNGRKGWSYEELVPYFERVECLYNSVTQSHYGTEGELSQQCHTIRSEQHILQDLGRFRHLPLPLSLV
jgi:choline dehydrogenase